MLEEHNLPASIELSLVDLFVVTLTLLDLAKRDRTEKAQLVSRPLRTKFSHTLDLLGQTNATELCLSDAEKTSGVFLVLLELVILPGATRDGFFRHDVMTRALRTLGNVATLQHPGSRVTAPRNSLRFCPLSYEDARPLARQIAGCNRF